MILRLALSLGLLLLWMQPVWAACPTIASSWLGNPAPTASANHVFTMPSGLASGDLLLCFITGNRGNIDAFSPASSGLTELYDSMITAHTAAGYYKIATGSEGASLTITSSGTAAGDDLSSGICYRITGWHGTTPPEDVTSLSTGNSNAPDSPSIDPSWAAEDTLYLAIAHLSNNFAFTGYPASYTDGEQAPATGQSEAVATARRCILGGGAAEDPAAFSTAPSSGSWQGQTVAIRPAAAASLAGPLVGGKLINGGLIGGGLVQ